MITKNIMGKRVASKKVVNKKVVEKKPADKKASKVQGELIYGVHPIVQMLKAKRRKIYQIYTTKPMPKAWKDIEPLLAPRTPIQYVSREILAKMVNSDDHQGVVAWVQSYPYRKQFFDVKKHPFLVMLDGVQDVRNLGAIIRSSYCTGVNGIIICSKSGAPVNAAAIKASAGLAECLEIYEAASPVSAIHDLKKAGYSVYLTTFDGKDARDVTYTEPLCVVIGSEGFGVSKSIFDMGTRITLAQRTDDISYNASVAAGIILFLAGTQNKKI